MLNTLLIGLLGMALALSAPFWLYFIFVAAPQVFKTAKELNHLAEITTPSTTPMPPVKPPRKPCAKCAR